MKTLLLIILVFVLEGFVLWSIGGITVAAKYRVALSSRFESRARALKSRAKSLVADLDGIKHSEDK